MPHACSHPRHNAVALTVSMLDMFVAVLHRGSEELESLQPPARDAMNQVLDAYEAAGLPEFDRAPDTQGAELSGDPG